MRRSVQTITAAVITSALLVGCSVLRTQDVAVVMTEGAWLVDPVSFSDARGLDITFINEGAESHRPLVAATEGTIADLEAHLVEFGDANLVDELAGDDAIRGYGAALIYGNRGHFHPGGPDVIELPPDARVQVTEEATSYLFTSSVAPGTEHGASLSISNFGKGGEPSTFAVVCMDPAHAGRGEYAVFGIES